MPTPAIKALDSRQQYWQRNAGLWGLALIMCAFCLLILNEVGFKRGFKRAYLDAHHKAQNALETQTLVLESRLEKYRLLPVLMARQSQFANDMTLADSAAVTSWLQQLNYLTGSYNVLLADAEGHILNGARQPQQGFPALDDNALIEVALQSRLGRSYLITNDHQPLYGFSSLVERGNRAPLVIIFLLSLSPVIESWNLSSANIIAWDHDQIIRLAGNSDLLGQHRPITLSSPMAGAALAHVELKSIGWIITASQPILREGLIHQILLSSLLVCLTIFIFFALFIRRKELQTKQILRDQLYAQELEKQISYRTAELASANLSLTEEINERRYAEQQLQNKQQELIHSAKLATIGQMSTMLSHEYNQPLAAMRGYAENALRFLLRQRTEPAAENLQRIMRQADRLGQLSKTLLSFAGKPNTPMTAVNVSAGVNEAVMLAQPNLNKYQIEVTQDISKPLRVKGHAVQFSQVILNLLNNAIDAHKDASSQAKGKIEIHAQEKAQFVQLQVADNGPGIAQALQDSLFEPFVTSKPTGQGLGLGLSIIRDIITEHQGTLAVTDSHLGGACFTIRWPIWS